MLVGALTGLRDVRAPLAVGYVTLLALWLLLYHAFPETAGAVHRSYPEVSGIAHDIGPVGVAIAASFAAFLIGTVLVRLSARALRIRGTPIEADPTPARQKGRKWISITHDAEMDDLELRLQELVKTRVDAIPEQNRADPVRQLTRPQGSSKKWFRVRKEGAEERDVDALPRAVEPHVMVRIEAKSGRIDERILARDANLYNELYRLRSEAELRAGLLPALSLLFVAIAIRVPWSPWLLVLLIPASCGFLFLLMDEAFELRSRARGIALRAVLDGLVSTPTLDLIDQYAKQLVDASGSGATAAEIHS
jgi:hypothetical protein